MAKRRVETKNNKQAGSRTMQQISKVMALTMAVSPLVAVVPTGVSAVVSDGLESGTLASNNTYIDITVSTGVYGNIEHTLPITTDNLGKLFYQTDYGTATWVDFGSITTIDGNSLVGGETSFRVYLSFTGIPNGKETIEITPSSDHPIYDSNGVTINSTSTSGVMSLNSQDSAEPVFSTGFPNVSDLTSSSFNLNVQLNEAATVYYVVLDNSEASLSVSEVLTGSFDIQGSFQYLSGSANNNSPINHLIDGLVPNTQYTVHMVAQDFSTGTPNVSSTVTILGNVMTSSIEATSTPTPSESPSMIPPFVAEDTTYNYVNLPITLTFSSFPDWVANITSLAINEITLAASDYAVTDGNIRFKPGVITTGTNNIIISATNYSDVSLFQEIIANPNPDTAAPAILAASTNAEGNQIILQYDKDLYTEDSLNASDFFMSENVSGYISDVSFDLTDTSHRTVLLSVTEIIYGAAFTVNAAAGAVLSLAGTLSAEESSISVTNNTLDMTRPILDSATIDENQIVLTFNEALDQSNLPVNAAFIVNKRINVYDPYEYYYDESLVIDYISFDESNPDQVILQLVSPVGKNDSISINYVASFSNPITDLDGKAAGSFTGHYLSNNTPDNFDGDPVFTSMDQLAGRPLAAGTKIVSFSPTSYGTHVHLEFPHDLNNNLNHTVFTDNFNVDDLQLIANTYDGSYVLTGAISNFVYTNGSLTSSIPSIDFDYSEGFSSGTLYDLNLASGSSYFGDEITLPQATYNAEAVLALSYSSGSLIVADKFKFSNLSITFPPMIAESAVTNISGNEIILRFNNEVDSDYLDVNNFGLSPSEISVISATYDPYDLHNVVLQLQGSLTKEGDVTLVVNKNAVKDKYGDGLDITTNLDIDTNNITEFAPESGPSNLTFVDQDLWNGYISGEVTANKPSDESTIAYYFLVWADADGEFINYYNPIAYLRPNGSDLIFQIPYGTYIPEGATQMAAFSSNNNGINPTPAFITFNDKKYAIKLGVYTEDPIESVNDHKTRVVVYESVTDNTYLVYKNLGSNSEGFQTPVQGDILSSVDGYLSLPPDGIIDAAIEDLIVVAEVETVTGAVYKFGYTYANVQISAPELVGVSFEDISGFANNNKTQIHLPAVSEEGNSFKYTFMDINHPMMTPNLGENTNYYGNWQPITNNSPIEAHAGQPIGVAEVDSNGLVVKYKEIPAIVDYEMQPVLEFDHNLLIISEADGKIKIKVNRTGSSIGVVSAVYSVSGGTATNDDYVLQTGTLTFAPGELSKSFEVALINDYQVEPDKTFLVSLSSPTGGSMIGPMNTVFVTIANDDVHVPMLNVHTEDATGIDSNGKTKLSLKETVGDINNKFVYKNIQNNIVPWPSVGETLDLNGFADAIDGTLIDASMGDHIAVAEVNSVTGAVHRFGITNADVRQTAPEFSGLFFTDKADFTNNSYTIINLPSAIAEHSFKYTYLSDDFQMPIPNVGDLTNHEGWKTIANLGSIQAQDGQLIGVVEVDGNGQVVKYSIGNAVVINDNAEITPPTATVPTIEGNTAVGQQLNANYAYADVNDDLESNSVYQWYRASSVNTTKTPINGATSLSYLLTEADLGQYLFFSVQPVAATGTDLVGITMTSAGQGPIKGMIAPIFIPDTTDTFTVSPIEFSYESDTAWVAANPVIFNGETQLSSDQYSITANNIIINAGALTKGQHAISIRATGYQNVDFVQNVTEASETFAINYDSTVTLDRTQGGIIAIAHIDVNAGHEGNESIVFQLMKGNTPIGIIALNADIQGNNTFTAQFENINDPSNTDYRVEVFIVNHFTNNTTNIGLSLATPATIQ